RLGSSGGNQIVEDDVGTPDGRPTAGIVAVPVKEVQNRISLFAARIVSGRSVDIVVAVIANHPGLVEVVMKFAAWYVVGFPSEAGGTRDVEFTCAIEKIGFDGVIGGIEIGHTVHLKGIAVKIGSQRSRGNAPQALVVSLHGQRIGGTFDGDRDF